MQSCPHSYVQIVCFAAAIVSCAVASGRQSRPSRVMSRAIRLQGQGQAHIGNALPSTQPLKLGDTQKECLWVLCQKSMNKINNTMGEFMDEGLNVAILTAINASGIGILTPAKKIAERLFEIYTKKNEKDSWKAVACSMIVEVSLDTALEIVGVTDLLDNTFENDHDAITEIATCFIEDAGDKVITTLGLGENMSDGMKKFLGNGKLCWEKTRATFESFDEIREAFSLNLENFKKCSETTKSCIKASANKIGKCKDVTFLCNLSAGIWGMFGDNSFWKIIASLVATDKGGPSKTMRKGIDEAKQNYARLAAAHGHRRRLRHLLEEIRRASYL